MTEEGIVAEIEIDLTTCRFESVPPNEPQYPDDLDQVKGRECTFNDLRCNGAASPPTEDSGPTVRPTSGSTVCLVVSEAKKSSKARQCMEGKLKIVLFCLVIAAIWGGLLVLPIVFFNIRADSEQVSRIRFHILHTFIG